MRSLGPGSRRPPVIRRSASVVALVSLLAMALSGPLAAQEVGEEGPTEDPAREPDGETERPSGEVGELSGTNESDDGSADQDEEIELLTDRLPVVDGAAQDGSTGLVMWPAGRRAYQVVVGPESTRAAVGLAAIDLDSLAEVDRATITSPERPIFVEVAENVDVSAYIAVDPVTGRLFVPYAIPSPPPNPSCPASLPCVAGIYVVDGATLEVLETFPLRSIGVDGSTVFPTLRAMTYAPDAGGAGKLHLLVESQYSPGINGADPKGRVNQALAVQIDAATGEQDWATRVEACTGFNQAAGNTGRSLRNTIFRVTGGGEPPRLYVGCLRSGSGVAIGKIRLDEDQPGHPPVSQQTFVGPPGSTGFIADPSSERILARTSDQAASTSIAVFDGRREAFIGAIGVGPYSSKTTAVGLDTESGRLYLVVTDPNHADRPQGLFVGTGRGATIGQAVPVSHLRETLTSYRGEVHEQSLVSVAVDPATDERARRIFVRPGATGSKATAPPFYYVIEDRAEVAIEESVVEAIAPPSDDVPLVDGATTVGFTGAARGYGFRALLLGGLEGIVSSDTRGYTNSADIGDDSFDDVEKALKSSVGPAAVLRIIDALADTELEQAYLETVQLPRPGGVTSTSCIKRDREFVFGAVANDTEALIQTQGASATAVAADADPQTVKDLEDPAGRCAADALTQLEDLVGAIGVRLPVGDEDARLSYPDEQASCVAPGERESDRHGSQLTPGSQFLAEVDCRAGDMTTGIGRTRAVELGPVVAGESFSTFRLERVPGGGLVTTVRSVVRDVDIAGAVHIDEVEAVAVSWATGRAQPPEALDADDPRCDTDRTAGTCLTRTLRGVSAGDFHCSECVASNEQMAQAMQQALGSQWRVRIREPERSLAAGSDNGALAAIQKPFDELFADAVLNGDIRETLPTLELVRINDDTNGRVRQVYQFAGVQLASVFRIQCLLEIIDGRCTQRPGALSIELLDLEGLPLAGGTFELYHDVTSDDEDGEGSEAPADDATPTPSETPSPDPGEDGGDADAEGEDASGDEGADEDDGAEEDDSDPSADASPSPSPSEDVDATLGGTQAPLGAPADDPSPEASEEDVGDEPSDDASEDEAGDEPSDDPSGDGDEASASSDGDVEAPVDGADDGSLVDPLVDELVDGGVCTTSADGVGDCRFEGLAPGDYIVRQTAAPDGFLAAADFPVTIGSGQDLTTTFTNVSAIGQVDISLTDGAGAPLEGGVFSIGAAGATDALTPAAENGGAPTGSCTTSADGTCSITVGLPDGPRELMLSQDAAPDGFLPAPDTPLTLAPGQTFTFTFTNIEALGGSITIDLVDDLSGAPLAGGVFEVHADDGDGVPGNTDVLVATCATGGDGACTFDPVGVDAASLGRDGPVVASGTSLTVPLGAYVVHQTATADGYGLADDLAFVFDLPGQNAAITVRNGGAGTGTPSGSSGHVDVGTGGGFSPPPVSAGTSFADVPPPEVAPTQTAGISGPTIEQILQAPSQLARLIVRDPLQALAFIGAWGLFAAAALTIHRRLLLADTLAT